MKVFMITSVPMVPPWDQGDKNLAYALTRVLPQHEFQVLTAHDAPQPLGDNLTLTAIYQSTRPGLREKAGVYWWFLRQGKTARPDLYHLVYRPYPLSSWVSRLLPEFRRRPTIHTVPATANHQPLNRSLLFADRVVATSRYGQRQLQQLGFADAAFIPTGINVRRWARLAREKGRYKVHLGLQNCPTILFPGHYGPGYGADVLLRAIPEIAAAIPNVRILFACRPRTLGDQGREEAARQALVQSGLAENALFYNVVTDMRPLIGASDLTVLPLETMHDKVDLPTTLLESLAAGTPVVITDLPPMNELLHTNGHGIGRAVPPGDVSGLVGSVVDLLQDQDRREAMARRGQEMVLAHYDIRPVAAQYEKLYLEMVP